MIINTYLMHLWKKNGSVLIHKGNIKILGTEMFKIRKNRMPS